MPSDCTTLSRIVPYRVYCVILRRPSSPSFDSFSRYGQTTVSSCRMMDALMYGMMPRAKMVTRDRFPPENMSYRPNIVLDTWFAIFRTAAPFTLADGILCPMRYTP